MGEAPKVAKGLAKLPEGIAGFGFGFVVGFMIDRLAEYIYVTAIPDPSKRPITPMFAFDDWIVILLGLLPLIAKKYSFVFGYFLAFLVSSGYVPRR